MSVQQLNSDAPTLPNANTTRSALPYLRPMFVERQRVRGWAAWVGVAMVAAVQLFIFLTIYRESGRFGAMLSGLLLALPVLISVAWLQTALVVRVDVDGVHVRWFPFTRLTIPHGRIVAVRVETYDPMNEFGGWGIKGPPGRWGWCYTVSGREGVRIELDDRHRLLIGSQRAHELAEAVRSARG